MNIRAEETNFYQELRRKVIKYTREQALELTDESNDYNS